MIKKNKKDLNMEIMNFTDIVHSTYKLNKENEEQFELLKVKAGNDEDMRKILDNISRIDKRLYDLRVQANINSTIVDVLTKVYKTDFSLVPEDVVDEIVRVSEKCKLAGCELTNKEVIVDIICRVDENF
jgi:hypothetical protein